MSNPWAQWLGANPPNRYTLSRKAGWDAFVNAAARAPLSRLTRAELVDERLRSRAAGGLTGVRSRVRRRSAR